MTEKMSWKEIYESKKCSPQEAVKMIKSGDRVLLAHAVAEPKALVDAMVENKDAYKGVTVWNTYFGNSKNTLHGYPEPWNVWPSGDYGEEVESVPFTDQMKEIAWANAHNHDVNCPSINTWCSGGKRKAIFGREFDNLCVSIIGFTDPDSESVECAKKLMEMKKHVIDMEE